MSEYLYWDNFANDIVIKIDEFSPPERYTQIIEGVNDIFIEKWSCVNLHSR